MLQSDIREVSDPQCKGQSSRREFLKQLGMALSAGSLAALPACFMSDLVLWSGVPEQLDNPHLQLNLSGESLEQSVVGDTAASRVPRYFYVREGVRIAIVDDYGGGENAYLQFTNRELNVIAAALDSAPIEWLKHLRVIRSKEVSKSDRVAGSASLGQPGVMTLYVEEAGKGGGLLASAKNADQSRKIGSHPEGIASDRKEQTSRAIAQTPLFLYNTVLHELGHIIHYRLQADLKQREYWRILHRLSGGDPDNYVSDYAATDTFEDFAETVEGYTYDSQASIKEALLRLERGKPICLLKVLFVMSQALTEDLSQIHFFTPAPNQFGSINEPLLVAFGENTVTAGQLALGLNEQGQVISCQHDDHGGMLPFPGYFVDYAPKMPVSGSSNLIELFGSRPEVIQPADGTLIGLEREPFPYVRIANMGTERGGVRFSDLEFDRYMFLSLLLPTAQSERMLHFDVRFIFKDGTIERAFDAVTTTGHPSPITLKYDFESEFDRSHGWVDLEAMEILFEPHQTMNIMSAQVSPDSQLMLLNQPGDIYYDRETNRSWFSSHVVEQYLFGT